MYFRNYFRQFLRDVRAQKLRMFLTLFGLVWGTAAVTLLLAFGQGLGTHVKKQQKGLGENIVIAWPSRTSRPWQGLPRGRRLQVTREDVEAIRTQIPEITYIAGEYSADNAKVRFGTKTVAPSVVGANPEFAVMRNIIPNSGGRFYNQDDMDLRRRVVFIGDELATDLFGDKPPIGETVYIDAVPFQVIGVMQKKGQDSSYSGRDKDKAFVPYTTLQAMYGFKYVDNFVFQVSDAGVAKRAQKGVLAMLGSKYRFDPEDEEAIGMWDTTEGMKFMDVFFGVFNTFLGVVGAMTLVVGGIGVSNIMNVAVEERTKEIGIKMALGAKKRYVLGQFLTETLLITLIGGAVGFFISWAVCASFPVKLEEYVGRPEISFKVAAITTAILGSIGLLAGWFPARSAANLKPVEALRM
jgi:putative ABC transport system permease protein